MPNGTFHKAKRPKWKCLFNEKTMLLDLFLQKANAEIMHTLSQSTGKRLQTNTLQLHIRGCDICGKICGRAEYAKYGRPHAARFNT